MPIGAARASVWRRKTTTSSVTNYTLIRYEGHTTSSGTTPGSSNSIYEIYIFTNGYIELRIGNWPGTGGIVGQYTSAGTGVAFPNAGYSTPQSNTV